MIKLKQILNEQSYDPFGMDARNKARAEEKKAYQKARKIQAFANRLANSEDVNDIESLIQSNEDAEFVENNEREIRKLTQVIVRRKKSIEQANAADAANRLIPLDFSKMKNLTRNIRYVHTNSRGGGTSSLSMTEAYNAKTWTLTMYSPQNAIGNAFGGGTMIASDTPGEPDYRAFYFGDDIEIILPTKDITSAPVTIDKITIEGSNKSLPLLDEKNGSPRFRIPVKDLNLNDVPNHEYKMVATTIINIIANGQLFNLEFIFKDPVYFATEEMLKGQ